MKPLPNVAVEARLWQLISAAAPVGAFHFSEGLETAVEVGWVTDGASLERWLREQLHHSLSRLDLALILRVMDAWRARDLKAVLHWNAVADACRETREVREQHRHMGHALGRLARGLGEPFPDAPLSYAPAFALMAENRCVEGTRAIGGYAFAWCENQVVGAQKLLSLGQLAAQGVLAQVSTGLDAVVATAAACDDTSIGMGIPCVTLASMRHETQYSRLFRS